MITKNKHFLTPWTMYDMEDGGPRGRVITVCYSNKSISMRGMMHCSRHSSTTLQNAPKGRPTRPAVTLHL